MEHVFSISDSRNFNQISQGKLDSSDVAPPFLVAPSNTSYGGATNSDGSIVAGNTVNVVKDFYWTYTKSGGRTEVPKIILTEKRLKVNTLISQLKYSFGVTASNIEAGLKDLSQNSVVQSFLGVDAQAIQAAAGSVSQARTTAESFIGNLFPQTLDENNAFAKNKYLKPYKNLYITEDTGWRFILPYFDNYNSAAQNVFAGDSNTPFLSLAKTGAEFFTNIADFMNVLRNPTDITFVERAKLYNYPVEGEEFSFTFPLINTGGASFEDVIRNWELLFLMLYNNKPARRNVSVIDPPVLYQVNIPGVKSLPFCYISNIAVDFTGSRRELSFDLPMVENVNVTTQVREAVPLDPLDPSRPDPLAPEPNNYILRDISNRSITRKISTIVPDAYLVKITLKSLLAETKNMMMDLVNENPIVKTETITESAFLNEFDNTRSNLNANTPFRPADVNTR